MERKLASLSFYRSKGALLPIAVSHLNTEARQLKMPPLLSDIEEWLSKKYWAYTVTNNTSQPINVKFGHFFLDDTNNIGNLFYSIPEWFLLSGGKAVVFKIFQREEYLQLGQLIQPPKYVKSIIKFHFSILCSSALHPEMQKRDFCQTRISYDSKPFALHLNVQIKE